MKLKIHFLQPDIIMKTGKNISGFQSAVFLDNPIKKG